MTIEEFKAELNRLTKGLLTMNEMETLLKWYEICVEQDKCYDNCPYYEMRHTLSGKEGCYLGMLANAVKLLKKSE